VVARAVAIAGPDGSEERRGGRRRREEEEKKKKEEKKKAQSKTRSWVEVAAELDVDPRRVAAYARLMDVEDRLSSCGSSAARVRWTG
jgi:hypothetical protein